MINQRGWQVKSCINVANNRIDASIVIFETENSSFTDDATLYEDVCEKLLVQVSLRCQAGVFHDGGMESTGTNSVVCIRCRAGALKRVAS